VSIPVRTTIVNREPVGEYPAQSYSNPRQSSSEPTNDEYDSRYDPRPRPEVWRGQRDQENSNREWVSGTGQPPYREERPGFQRRNEPGSTSRFRPDDRKSSGPGPSFAGRGPQGYKRSDDRIVEDINEEITRDHDLDATNISVEAKDGEVILKAPFPTASRNVVRRKLRNPVPESRMFKTRFASSEKTVPIPGTNPRATKAMTSDPRNWRADPANDAAIRLENGWLEPVARSGFRRFHSSRILESRAPCARKSTFCRCRDEAGSC
jgi:hypothetical protein